jgi:two-component system sensor histidine kinase TorS
MDYNAVATQAMLRAIGVESEIASNGSTALERLQNGHYDLALVDWNLPGLMGTEVVKRLRASEASGQRRLIIGTSAYTATSDRQACLDAGMDAFIAKPLSPEKIAATLRAIPGWNETTCLPAEARTNPASGDAGQLDLKLLLFLSDRSSGGLAAQIDRYLRAVDVDREEAHAAVAARDGRRIHQQAHRLLAHADAVKCEPLAELAAQLQSEAATTEHERLQQLLRQIEEAFAGLRNKLDSIRASTGPA